MEIDRVFLAVVFLSLAISCSSPLYLCHRNDKSIIIDASVDEWKG